MKSILISFSLLLMAQLSCMAQENTDLFDAFPPMPASVSDDDLQKMITSKKFLDAKFDAVLDVDKSLEQKIYPVGKIETKTTVILIFGKINHGLYPDNPAMSGVSMAFNKKTGKFITGTLQHYLFMTGEDAFRRKGQITYSNDTLKFVTKSFTRDTGMASAEDDFESTYKVEKGKLVPVF